MFSDLKKPPYKRKFIHRQLESGHLRIDLNQPMAEGNMIMFSGKSQSGKLEVSLSTAQNFLQKSEKNKVVIISYRRE